MRLRVTELTLPWKRLFAEFGVIVGGVLIALAVDAWWERQQEQNQAEKYLQQLLVDFQGTQRRLQGTITGDTRTLERVNSVVDRALRGPLPSADSLELPTGYNYFEPLTGTLTALVEGGDLRLISNDSIRFELIAFSALINATESILQHTETMVWRSTERLTLGRARHSRSAAQRPANGDRVAAQVDVAGALNDPEIISALQVQAVASQIRLFNLRRLEDPTARIIRRLETELGGNH
jgi:hypothetical protein